MIAIDNKEVFFKLWNEVYVKLNESSEAKNVYELETFLNKMYDEFNHYEFSMHQGNLNVFLTSFRDFINALTPQTIKTRNQYEEYRDNFIRRSKETLIIAKREDVQVLRK